MVVGGKIYKYSLRFRLLIDFQAMFCLPNVVLEGDFSGRLGFPPTQSGSPTVLYTIVLYTTKVEVGDPDYCQPRPSNGSLPMPPNRDNALPIQFIATQGFAVLQHKASLHTYITMPY